MANGIYKIPEDFEKSLAVNVTGYMIGIQLTIPMMQKNGKGWQM